MCYQPPIQDMLFTIRELAGYADLQAMPTFAEAGDDTVAAVLNEAARVSSEVIAPLNRLGDLRPAAVSDGRVITTPGFAQAFRTFVEGGWQGIQHPESFGGQHLPKVVATACSEMFNSGSLAFALCPLLTDGTIEALLTAGSSEQQQRFIPALIRGDWTGTMNLTEPDAGSDLARVRTRAERQADGSYRLFGQKIYITYGDHDFAENIIHMVLARTPDAPEGVKGLSLFIVPKFLVDEQGRLGARNDVYCASLEHKLGIKASPTAVLLYGAGNHPVAGVHGAPQPGAIGWLMGAEGRGLEYMFIMMNAARFAVGVQGVALAEVAYQKAVAYARERVQSRAVEGSARSVPIIQHPDVRRMLMTMRALCQGARSLAYVAAAACDAGSVAPDAEERERQRTFYDFLVPIIKGFATEMSLEVASLSVQVHGGMGFVEETGVAQYYRDARILTIYEGTTAIQANDLLGRKTLRDGGQKARELLATIGVTAAECCSSDAELAAIGGRLTGGVAAVSASIDALVAQAKHDVRLAYAGSVPYLMLFGTVLAGWQLARSALRARQLLDLGGGDTDLLDAKIATARFYAEHLLVRASAYRDAIVNGPGATLALREDAF